MINNLKWMIFGVLFCLTLTNAFDNTQFSPTYTYDPNGRQSTKEIDGNSQSSFSWTDNNRLARLTKADGSTVDYTYDFVGRRVSETDGTTATNYLIDPTLPYGQTVADYAEDGTAIAKYTYGLERVSQEREGVLVVYLSDGQGSVRQLVDVTEVVTDEQGFTAFGEELYKTGNTVNRFGYTGEAWDANMQMQYLRARWMDPSVGRFVGVDPFSGDPMAPVSLHRYLYAGASPILYSDPSGEIMLMDLMAGHSIAIRHSVAYLPIALSLGKAIGGRALRQIGVVTERAVVQLLPKFLPNADKIERGIKIVGKDANRILDFWIKVADKMAILGVKYKIPSKAGEAFNRLVSQMEVAANSKLVENGAQVVLWTYRAPSVREMGRVMTALGPNASSVQMVHGLAGLQQWVRFFFLPVPY